MLFKSFYGSYIALILSYFQHRSNLFILLLLVISVVYTVNGTEWPYMC